MLNSIESKLRYKLFPASHVFCPECYMFFDTWIKLSPRTLAGGRNNEYKLRCEKCSCLLIFQLIMKRHRKGVLAQGVYDEI